MADSLKDQLLRAGFAEAIPQRRKKPKKKLAKKNKISGKPKKPPIIPRKGNARFSTPPNAEDEAKKSQKTRVQTLIESHETKDNNDRDELDDDYKNFPIPDDLQW